MPPQTLIEFRHHEQHHRISARGVWDVTRMDAREIDKVLEVQPWDREWRWVHIKNGRRDEMEWTRERYFLEKYSTSDFIR